MDTCIINNNYIYDICIINVINSITLIKYTIYIYNINIIGLVMTTTTISIKSSTKNRIQLFGSMGESFDTVLNKMCDDIEQQRGSPK